MASHIPEDIIYEVLKHRVYISRVHAFLAGFPLHYEENNVMLNMPCPDILRVSKRWLRVGTSMFYDTIVLKNTD